MNDACDEHHQFQFTSDDLAKLRWVVRGKASAELTADDVDDITGEILLSACVTAAKASTTAPVSALAFTYAALPSYYVNARTTAAAVAGQDPWEYEWPSTDSSAATLSIDIRDVLHSLSPLSRTIIWMGDIEGMTLAETATALGMSVATVHRRRTQAHDDFRAAWAA